jgi:HK97 family phage prohead protease
MYPDHVAKSKIGHDAQRSDPPAHPNPPKPERRALTPEVSKLELRSDGGGRRLRGHAAIFDSVSELLYGSFYEVIRPGAFAESIGKDDVRALWNHDPGHVLGRNSSGTLELREDQVGLAVDITPPPTTWARDLLVSIERGDVTQMSFAFQTVTDSWSLLDGVPLRVLEKLSVVEVSPVTFPAYPDTDIGARAIAGVEARDLIGAWSRLSAGSGTRSDRDLVRHVAHEMTRSAGPTPAEQLDLMARRLQLAALAL